MEHTPSGRSPPSPWRILNELLAEQDSGTTVSRSGRAPAGRQTALRTSLECGQCSAWSCCIQPNTARLQFSRSGSNRNAHGIHGSAAPRQPCRCPLTDATTGWSHRPENAIRIRRGRKHPEPAAQGEVGRTAAARGLGSWGMRQTGQPGTEGNRTEGDGGLSGQVDEGLRPLGVYAKGSIRAVPFAPSLIARVVGNAAIRAASHGRQQDNGG